MAANARAASERALAWLYTGPAGHLWSVTADVLSIWPRVALRALGHRLRNFSADRGTDPAHAEPAARGRTN